MKESRLFKIIYYLLEKGQATAPELAEKFEVSVRTIYRDIDALSEAGIPVYAETGRSGGIRLMEHFALDKAVLSEEEKQEILTALQSLQATQNIDSEDTVKKLSALFRMGSEDWLEVDFSRWGAKAQDHEKFESLKSAILHCRNVKIRYAGAYASAGERIVSPLKLIYKAKAWYLKAFCMEKQDYRTFKLNRILAFEVLEEGFRKSELESVCSFREQTNAPEQTCRQITLRFPKEMAYRVYDEFDATQVWRQENGDLIASARMPDDAWLVGFLLSFGAQVDVIEPAYLREVLAEQAKLILEKNKP